MKKLVIALVLAMILVLMLVSPVMADGPGKCGQGRDASSDPPPNEVYVPSKAFDARGELPPGNPDSQGAIFHEAICGGGV